MAALSSSIEPRKDEYAGEEVSAVVLDPGYSTVRAGFAGEDTPKSVMPTYYAVAGSKPIFGDHVVDVPREDTAIRNPMSRDGVVEDWNVAEELFKHSFAAKLTGVRPNRVLQDWLNHDEAGKPFTNLQQKMAEAVDTEQCLENHPLFMTEPSWNPIKAREKSAEIALESWATPGFYLGRAGVMAAFSAGKPTALVVDIGAATASITPVHDGFILKKGVQRSNLAGDFISSQVRNMFAANQPQPIVIHPHYLVKSKLPVDAGQPANAVYKEFPPGFKPPQQSFRRYREERTLLEFKELVVQVWTGPTPLVGQEDMARGLPGKPFEFPDGYNQLFTSDRFKVAESLFDHRAYISPPSSSEDADLFPAPGPEKTILAMIKQSLGAVDVDIRPILLSNVVVTGGSSLIPGFTQRLNTELDRMFPSTRIKLQASGNLVERKFGSWIGGSIMASLGTFHQMWISKKEYDEHGAGIIEKRCR